MTNLYKRPDGFPSQHLLVLPHTVIASIHRDPLLNLLYPIATGFFPNASGHLMERSVGLPEAIIIVCTSGSGWVKLENRAPVVIRADEGVIIPSRMAHSYGANEENPWSIMWAHFTGIACDDYLKRLGITSGNELIYLSPGTIDQLAFANIYEHLEQGLTQTNLLSSVSRLRMVLAEINRLRLPSHSATRSSEEGVQWSVDWMRIHIDRPANLSQLARVARLSVPHYSMLFRRKTGFTPVDYFLRLKVQNACKLLDTTDLPIKQVATAIGCADQYYFSRLFKKVMSISPRGYRNIKKG